MNIFFAIRIVLSGAPNCLIGRAASLCGPTFTPFPIEGMHIALRFEEADHKTISRCQEILSENLLQTPAFCMRVGQHLDHFPESGVVWADVQSPELGLLWIELARLLQDTRPLERQEIPTFHLSLGTWSGRELPAQPASSGIVVPVSAVHLLTRIEEAPRTYRNLEWNYLPPSREQTQRLAGNAPPTRNGHST